MSVGWRRVLAIAGMAVSMGVAVWAMQGDRYPDFTGERKDGAGNVGWRSSVTAKDKTYEYLNTFANRDEKLRCRFHWEPLQWKATVPPAQTFSQRCEITAEPRRVAGPLHYNGGASAGGAKADTQAWAVNDPANKQAKDSVLAEAQLSIERGDDVIPFLVTGKSTWFEDFIHFRLLIKTDAKWIELYPGLMSELKIRWTSVDSTGWQERKPIFELGRYEMGSIRFARIQDEPGKIAVHAFDARLPTKRPPTVRSGALVISTSPAGDKDILASAQLPGFFVP